ncbi:MAG TPA: peptide ABC transporter substrate-binding protein [Candidatus Saccharimonadales bacterium]|nr:peptide ABC transporter substrate-binding protein [Candidatus Saccharimonadales bacterium]
MPSRIEKLRFRRRFRKGQKQVEGLGQQAEQHIERHLFGRFENLKPIRRFLIGWLGLIILLIIGVAAQNINLGNYYQSIQTVPGGIYNEGVIGKFTNANPMYATSEADKTVSKLVFAGLFNTNDKGQLVGNLAKSYSVDSHHTTYTIKLKPHLTWQDGKPLTSKDVMFTYLAIQNPDAQSPLQNGWQGVKISAPDNQTVIFKLPGALTAFPYNLTNGIVPRHLLDKIAPADLRSADFNTVHPIGAGPFTWQGLTIESTNPDQASDEIALTPFQNYQNGSPKLQKFVVKVFATSSQLDSAFAGHQLTAADGLNIVSDRLKKDKSVIQNSLQLRAANMVFFKTSTGGVLTDQQVRQALVTGANVPQIISSLGYPVRAVREPILTDQLAYSPELTQAAYNSKQAKQLLTDDGWVIGKNGVRSKDGKPLTFALSSSDTLENHRVTNLLAKQWRELGVDTHVQLQDKAEFQSTVAYHNYEALLYGITLGIDPDVFVYWDSSQADIRSANRLNLSEWKSTSADSALESGRSRIDPSIRIIKYKPFLQAWQQAAPALGLYQPRFLYLTHGPVTGLTKGSINSPTDRFNNVQNWEIRQVRVTN